MALTPAEKLAAALAAIAAVLSGVAVVKPPAPPPPPVVSGIYTGEVCPIGSGVVILDTADVSRTRLIPGGILYVASKTPSFSVDSTGYGTAYPVAPGQTRTFLKVCVPRGTKVVAVSDSGSLPAVDSIPMLPGPGQYAGFKNCMTIEQVFYAGDSLFYVRPLGSRSRDSLVKADSTTDTKQPYGPQVLICNDSVKSKSREVISSGFGRISQAMRNAPNIGTLERNVVPSLFAGPIKAD